MTSDNGWQPQFVSPADFDIEAMNRLLSGQVAAIVIDEFLSTSECQSIVDRVGEVGLKKVLDGKSFESDYSGASAIDYKDKRETQYLEDAATARVDLENIFREIKNPLRDVLSALAQAWEHPVTIAERDGVPYFCGVFRFLNVAPIHNDWAPRDLPEWEVGQVSRQFTWNLYLSVPEEGGGVQIWNRQWNADDDTQLPKAEHGEGDPPRLRETPSVTITPKAGRFLIFDTRNYHSIRQVEGTDPCLGYSSFFGIRGERGPLILWS